MFVVLPIQSMARSWASEPWVMAQPPLSSPISWSAGTRTSSKKTSLKSA